MRTTGKIGKNFSLWGSVKQPIVFTFLGTVIRPEEFIVFNRISVDTGGTITSFYKKAVVGP